MLIDTHAHIYLEQFSDDLKSVLERAKEQGVEKILLPNIDRSSANDLKTLVKHYPEICYPMMGLHPCSVKQENWEEELAWIKEDLFSGKYIAVGEIGIDLYWDKTTLNIQQKAFAEQIQWSLDLNLPFAIHARDAFDEIFEVMSGFDKNTLNGVFHCFTGTPDQAEKILEQFPNFYFGLGGVSTFKNAGMDKTIPVIPVEKIVLETDAPYLSPVPYRGKRNEPSYVKLVAQRVADIKEMSLDRLSTITTNNAIELFHLT